jgi:hypothetical protein
MARRHGITTDTYKRFIIDSGEVRINYVSTASPGTLLGATRGGSTYTIETEYREMPVDGAKGPVKGGRRITRVVAKLVANFVEMSTDLFERNLPGSSHTTNGDGHDIVARSLQLADADYITNVAIIGEISDGDVSIPGILLVKNAIGDGNVEIGLVDNDESVNKVQFTGHFLPSDLDTEPWAIYWPHDSNPTTAGA